MSTQAEQLLPIGTVVEVRSWSGSMFTAEIIAAEDDIKNGEPGYDLSGDCWCYASQIVSVVG